MAAPQTQVQQQSSTHMMKTTRSGRPFVKVCVYCLPIKNNKLRNMRH